MNYGTPTGWEVPQTENSTSMDGSLSVTGTSQGSLGETSLGPMTPEVAYMGQIAYGIVAPIIISFGIFTNFLNLIVLTRPTLRGPTYRYLMWLAVANLLVCVILLPFTLHSHHTPVGYLSALYLAHLEMPFGNALIASSVYIVVGLSIDRFVAVCHPRKYRNLHSHRVASIRIAFSFVIGFFIYIPMSLGKKVVRAEGTEENFLPKENFKVTNTKWWIVYKCLLEICARFAPAVLLAFLNIWIIIEFKKVSRRRRLLTQNMAELSGFPSQSIVEMSQGTTQPPVREERDEASQILSQTSDSKAVHYQQKHKENATGRKSLKTLHFSHCSEEKNENSLNNHIEMNNIHSGNEDVKQPNGDCCLTTSFSTLDKVNSGERLSETLYRNYSSEGIKTSFEVSNGKPSEKILNSNGETCGQRKTDQENYPRNVFGELSGQKDSMMEDEPLNQAQCPSQGLEIAHIAIKVTPNSGRSGRKPMSARRLDMERRLVLLLVAIIIAFYITNIPTAILSLTFTEDKRSSLPYQIFRAIANNLEFLNFGLHFILYFLFSQDIRKTFMSILRRTLRHLSKRIFSSGTASKLPSVI